MSKELVAATNSHKALPIITKAPAPAHCYFILKKKKDPKEAMETIFVEEKLETNAEIEMRETFVHQEISPRMIKPES